jgi:hypothetical protein
VILAGWLLGCSRTPDPQIVGAFQDARREAAAVPTEPAPPDFAPDLVLHLSPRAVEKLVGAGLREAPTVTDKRELMGVTVETRLEVDGVSLKRSPRLEGFAAVTKLRGELTFDGGRLGRGEVPIEVEALLDVAVDSVTTEDAFRITADPRALVELGLQVPGVPAALMELLREPLRRRVEAELVGIDAYPVAQWRREGLPVRGFRVDPEGAGLRVAMLSTAVHPGAVPPDGGRALEGFRLDAATDSVLWLARTEAFARGPQRWEPGQALSYEVHAVPESLAIQDDTFRLGLRLWRLGAPSWWRDYSATGQVTVQDGQIELTVQGVAAGATSPRAGLVDPLAALAETVLLHAITEPLQHSLPASGSLVAREHRVGVEVREVRGEAGIVHVHGVFEVSN